MFAKDNVIDDTVLSFLMRISETSSRLFDSACDTVFGEARFNYNSQNIQILSLVVSANGQVLDSFEVDQVACMMDRPRRNVDHSSRIRKIFTSAWE